MTEMFRTDELGTSQEKKYFTFILTAGANASFR